jgi:hypothetical protein
MPTFSLSVSEELTTMNKLNREEGNRKELLHNLFH